MCYQKHKLTNTYIHHYMYVVKTTNHENATWFTEDGVRNHGAYDNIAVQVISNNVMRKAIEYEVR